MNRAKQYRVRLTEEEDELLKRTARELGLSSADVIRLGIRFYAGNSEYGTSPRSYRPVGVDPEFMIKLREDSEFISNWKQTFAPSIFQEYGERFQTSLQLAYLLTLGKYKGLVYYIGGKFVSSFVEAEESIDTTRKMKEPQTETVSEQEVKDDICHSLTKFLGGEWKGNEGIVNTFLAGLKVDLAQRIKT